MIRLFFVSSQHLVPSIVALNFDRFIFPKITHTYIHTGPLAPPDNLLGIYERHGIDVSNFTVIQDCNLMSKYPERINFYEFGGWIAQQLIKFAALDQCHSDRILIQDCDAFRTKPTNFFSGDTPIPLVISNGDQFQSEEYSDYLVKFTGLTKKTKDSFVTEYMPLSKCDWEIFKNQIENRFGQSWLDAMITQFKTDSAFVPQIWFSEYELLGNWLYDRYQPLLTKEANCCYLSQYDLQEFVNQHRLSKKLQTFDGVGIKGFHLPMDQLQRYLDYLNRIVVK